MIKNLVSKGAELNEKQIRNIIDNEIWQLTNDGCEKKYQELMGQTDLSDFFYYTRGHIFNNRDVSVAKVHADKNITGLFWDDFGMPYTTTTYTGSNPIYVNYKQHVLIWRRFFINPNTNTVDYNHTPRKILWDTDIYRGLLMYMATHKDTIGTKDGKEVYTEFWDFVIDSFSPALSLPNNEDPITYGFINKYSGDNKGNRWNLHTKKASLYCCKDGWYKAAESSSANYSRYALFELGDDNTEYNTAWYSDPEGKTKMEYHIYLYNAMTNTTIRDAMTRCMYGPGQCFEKLYLHNYLLGSKYSYRLFPVAGLNGKISPNKYHVKEYHVDYTGTQESNWVSSDGNFKFTNPYKFTYFAPINLYNNWYAGNYWYWAENTNLIRFFDIQAPTIYSRECFKNNDGENQIIEFPKTTAITSNKSSGNYSSFEYIKNCIFNFRVLTNLSQRQAFRNSKNLTFNFYTQQSETLDDPTSTTYYGSVFYGASDININYLGTETPEYYKMHVGSYDFYNAIRVKFNKPIYILQLLGDGHQFAALGDGTNIEIYNNVNTKQPHFASNMRLGSSIHFMGNVSVGDRAFYNSLGKVSWDDELKLTIEEGETGEHFKASRIQYIPKLISFEGSECFSTSTLLCIDMSHCDLDFVFPDNWYQGATALKVLILPSAYTGDPKTPESITIRKRNNVQYGKLTNNIVGDWGIAYCPFCDLDCHVVVNDAIFSKYSAIGSTGHIYLDGHTATFRDGWNYGGSVVVHQ